MPKKVYRVFQPASPRFAFEAVAFRTVADDQDMDLSTAAGQLRRRLDQRLEMLDRIEARDGADNQRVGRQRQPSAQVGARRRLAGSGPSSMPLWTTSIRPSGRPSATMCRLRSCDTEAMRPAACAMTGFSRRRLREGGASESRPCSVNTTRRPGRASRASAPYTNGEDLVTVEHVGLRLARDGRQTLAPATGGTQADGRAT